MEGLLWDTMHKEEVFVVSGARFRFLKKTGEDALDCMYLTSLVDMPSASPVLRQQMLLILGYGSDSLSTRPHKLLMAAKEPARRMATMVFCLPANAHSIEELSTLLLIVHAIQILLSCSTESSEMVVVGASRTPPYMTGGQCAGSLGLLRTARAEEPGMQLRFLACEPVHINYWAMHAGGSRFALISLINVVKSASEEAETVFACG